MVGVDGGWRMVDEVALLPVDVKVTKGVPD